MNTILKFTIVSLCLALTSAAHTSRSSDLSLIRFMAQTRDVSSQNPTRSMACFDYYLPVLNAIADQYETDYAACVDQAEAAMSKVDDATQPERDELQQSAETSCELLQSCVELKDSVAYFECFVTAGSTNSKTMYTISANASDVLSVVTEQFRLIQNDEYRCTNASERTYIENSVDTYDEMQSCLQGKSPVPTTTRAPPTNAPTNAPTDAPTEEATTEEEPVPTENPDDTILPGAGRRLSKYHRQQR